MAIRLLSSESINGALTLTGNLTGTSATLTGSLTGTSATFNTGAGNVGLAVYTSAVSTAPNVKFGRNASEYIGFKIQDRNNRIVFRQDETDGNHEAVFDIWSSTTGNKAFVFGASDNAGATFLSWLTIENANAIFAGTLTVAGGVVMNGNQTVQGNLTVDGTGTFGGVVTVNNPAISPAITAISSWSGTTRNPQIKFARIASAVAGEIGYSDPETNLYIGSTTNHDFRIRVNNNDIITCDTAQNVGIGTTSPNSRLEVATSTNINNYSDGAVQVVSNSPIAFVGASNLNPSLNRWGFKIREAADGDFNIHDYRHATTRMRINISGDIQIPTNSASLQLRSSGSGSYTSIRRDAANQLIVANTAGNQVFGIGNGGELAITNGASYSGTETYSNAWNSGYQTLILGSQLSPNSVYIITINVGSGFGTPPYYASAVFTIVTAPSTNSTGGGFDNIAPTATHVNSNVYWKYRLSCISPGRNGVEAWLVNGPTNPPANPTINVKATKIMTM